MKVIEVLKKHLADVSKNSDGSYSGKMVKKLTSPALYSALFKALYIEGITLDRIQMDSKNVRIVIKQNK